MSHVIDLIALLHDLEADNSNNEVAQSMRRLLFQQSCGADIALSHRTMENLLKSQASSSTKDDQVSHAALLMSAVVFYCRATDGSPKKGGRGASKIDKLLPANLTDDHREIHRVRNQALAHVHIGATDDDWHQQFLALVPNDHGSYNIMCTSRQHTCDLDTQMMLTRLLPAAQAIMVDRFKGCERDLYAKFQAHRPAIDLTPYRTTMKQLIGRHQVDDVLSHDNATAEPHVVFF